MDLLDPNLKGRPIPGYNLFQYKTLQSRQKGHGYVVVYRTVNNDIVVLYYFHTAQNWLEQFKVLLPFLKIDA